MSWKQIDATKAPCPCGNGIVITVREVDLRNHSRKKAWLVCSNCGTDGGDSLIKQQIQREKERVLAVFDLRYLKHWQSHFALCGTKREVWEILRQAGLMHRGLSTFYGGVRESTLPCYLRSLATISNIPKILTLLEIQDDDLNVALFEIFQMANPEHSHLLLVR